MTPRTTTLAVTLAAATASLAPAAGAAVLAKYSFETTAPTTDPFAADEASVVASDITTVGIVTDITTASSGTVVTANLPTPTDGASQLSIPYGSLDNDETPDEDYLQFTLTGVDAFDTLTFDADGQGTTLAQGFFQLFADTGGGFTSVGSTLSTTTNQQDYESFSVDLSGLASTGATTFRLAVADGGGGANNNGLEIDNLVVNGTPVPEPTAAAGLLGLGLLAARRRR